MSSVPLRGPSVGLSHFLHGSYQTKYKTDNHNTPVSGQKVRHGATRANTN
jgi:hypothetical protein